MRRPEEGQDRNHTHDHHRTVHLDDAVLQPDEDATGFTNAEAWELRHEGVDEGHVGAARNRGHLLDRVHDRRGVELVDAPLVERKLEEALGHLLCQRVRALVAVEQPSAR